MQTKFSFDETSKRTTTITTTKVMGKIYPSLSLMQLLPNPAHSKTQLSCFQENMFGVCVCVFDFDGTIKSVFFSSHWNPWQIRVLTLVPKMPWQKAAFQSKLPRLNRSHEEREFFNLWMNLSHPPLFFKSPERDCPARLPHPCDPWLSCVFIFTRK